MFGYLHGHHIYILDMAEVEEFKLDSKLHDCIITILSQDDFLQFNITRKFSHLFGLHVIYGQDQNRDIDLNFPMPLLNKPIYFYSQNSHDHFVLCPRINNTFWRFVQLNSTSKLCPLHSFEGQVVFLGESKLAGRIFSEFTIAELIATRILKAKQIEPIRGNHSLLQDGLVLPDTNEELVIDGRIQINGGWQVFFYHPDLEVTYPCYSLEFAMFSRYPINLMSWDSIIRVFDTTEWYILLATLTIMSILFSITHYVYR